MKNKDVKKSILKLSIKIVVIYLVYGLSWIFFTDKLVFLITQNPYFLTKFQTIKGFLFILISALILYGFLWETFSKLLHSEKKIKQTEKKWRSLVQNAPDIIIQMDNFGVINYINRNFDGILKEDAIGKKLTKFLPSKFSKIYKKNLREVKEQRKIKSFEVEIETKSKENVWLEIKMTPVDNGGSENEILSFARDVTSRKSAEKALRESEEKYRTLFEESKDVVFISTPEGKILDINSAGADLFGYSSKEELLEISIDKDLYWNPEDREKYKEILVREGFVKDFELTIKRRDGQKLIVLETARPVYDKNGKISNYRGILRDITDKKRLEEQLRQAQKLQGLGTLAGGIAHDFNNILGIILGYATMMESSNGDSKKLKWNLGAIVKAVNRGSALVQQILTFARKTDILFETVKVNATINELVRLTSETFPKTIRFKAQLQEDLPYIKADHNQVHQALLNLFVNARDAMPKGGTISVKTSTLLGDELCKKFPDANDQNYVSIVISDEGAGMDKETLNRVFEPFFTTKKRSKGTGLGLAVVYGVVSSHHGFIDVDSELNVGTTFNIYLPVAEDIIIPSHRSNGDQKSAKGGSETILFVEDEEMLRKLIENLLKDNGYKVLTAEDGEKAVEMYSKNADNIDLVITDMGLPKLNGWKAYQKMREYNPEVKMILASGYLDPEIRAELKDNSQEYFIQKPYNLNDMLKKVREVIEFSRN